MFSKNICHLLKGQPVRGFSKKKKKIQDFEFNFFKNCSQTIVNVIYNFPILEFFIKYSFIW